MRILFFAIDENSSSSGISKKIKSQAVALGSYSNEFWLMIGNRSSGFSVYKFEKTLGQLKLEQYVEGCEGETFAKKYEFYDGVVARNFNEICQREKIDAVYCRKIPMIPCLIKMFKRAKGRNGFVLGYEIPTFPFLKEHIITHQWIVLLSDLFFSKALYAHVDHFFIITDSENAKKVRFNHWSRLVNGIDVNEIPKRSSCPSLIDGLHLLGVANVAFWHGYDRLIEGLAKYFKNNNDPYPVYFHIAGDGVEMNKLKKITEINKLQEHVIFHGRLHGRQLDNLFEYCHIAIGSLGLHRLGLNESNILKAREYCARGMPFIMSLKDSDFGKDFPYIFYVNSDEEPIAIEPIITFARTVLVDSRHVATEMREYAIKHLDWKMRMREVFNILEKKINDKLNPGKYENVEKGEKCIE